MPFRLLADANAQTTIPLALTAGATSFVGLSTANFTNPAAFGNGQGSLTILDAGNPAFVANTPFATPFEYAYYSTNTVGTNTISGLTRGVAGTTGHAFFAGAQVAQGLLAEDIMASAPWKFDEQSPAGAGAFTIPSSGSIPASYLGIPFRHIRIKWIGRTTSGNGADVLALQANGDNTANYDYGIGLLATAYSSAASALGQTSARVGVLTGGTSAAGLFNSGIIEIPFAFLTGARRTLLCSTYRNDGSATVVEERAAASWRNTANPVTSLFLGAVAGNFATGSMFTTYLEP